MRCCLLGLPLPPRPNPPLPSLALAPPRFFFFILSFPASEPVFPLPRGLWRPACGVSSRLPPHGAFPWPSQPHSNPYPAFFVVASPRPMHFYSTRPPPLPLPLLSPPPPNAPSPRLPPSSGGPVVTSSCLCRPPGSPFSRCRPWPPRPLFCRRPPALQSPALPALFLAARLASLPPLA